MNASPHFRYYAAFTLILILVLLLRVQVRPVDASEPVAQETNPAPHYAVGATAGR